jgi:Carboxypeptidase regulatory-like domain/TonB-dependent Receptor Plug Domain
MTRLDRTIVSQLTPSVHGFFARLATLHILIALLAWISLTHLLSAQQPVSGNAVWQGELHNAAGNPIHGATIELSAPGHQTTAVTAPDGKFFFNHLPPVRFALFVTVDGRRIASPQAIDLATPQAPALLTLTGQETLSVEPLASAQETTGGVDLSSQAVSQLPLNKRDFSQLLLLAAGTMTDANGAANFTQQFAINGQRGVEATFAMDGADISDPEMGGSTFSNFNVDAVEEIQTQSGWMPAEIGRGAAGFTNIVTRSGKSGFHGSFFEFVRNSAFDARNYFDHSSIANPGRLPPFRRNEFGFTNGGPVILPHIYNGAGKTFYFGQYQGFRQVLGTTQVFPVPTEQERSGLDTTAFPGDVLTVPVDAGIARVLARYPLPNYPAGTYGVHTFASSSPVVTDADQFSLRFDHRISDRSQLFARFNFNNLDGPTTNPDQTVIDPAFGIRYIDHQRNLVLTYTRTVSSRLIWESSASITRATPSFPTTDLTDPAVKFNDGSYEPFNQAAGTVISVYGNLFQVRQNLSITTSKHAFKLGGEVRLNRDTTYFGISPNGEYDFGGGKAYSPVNISSQSGLHNIGIGDPLPDTLSGLLSGSPFIYTVVVAPPYFSGGEHIGAAAINRNAFAFFAQDTWKISPRLVLDYGLRYELYTPVSERAKRTSGIAFSSNPTGVQQQFVINPQPGYRFNLDGLGPRVQLDWLAGHEAHLRAGGAITTIPPNLFQDNSLTGSTPFAVYPRLTSAPAAPIPYGFQITPAELPPVYTPDGQLIFAHGTKAVPANTVMDLNRYQQDLAALSTTHQITPLTINSVDPAFGNAYLQTWTLGLERHFGALVAAATYIGTAAVRLARESYFNGYPGAGPSFAPYTQFDQEGSIIGGFGTENVVTSTAHSSYHALQTSLQGTVPHGGPGIQASYTWSKSLDETSSVIGGFISGGSGAISQIAPQNPFNTHPEKGPSTFDVAHTFTLSMAQDLHGESVGFLRPLGSAVTRGWELLSISSINSGSPFTVYSGVQQTDAGTNGADRPDQVGIPHLSTSRKTREDYFGLGANNASYFSIPINVPGGTGPNHGRFGTLGRNTFRGPAYYDFDFALIKNTPFGRRSSGIELLDLQFRAEFFNIFNIVNMGLPANTLEGAGFGEISRTAGTSRQIQFSLKLIY